MVEYDIKRKYLEEYSTVEKVGSEKPLLSKSVSRRINRLLISYQISKQARLNAAFKTVLVSK